MAQTYANWEYIIVNNRSEDNSLEIANAYAEMDSRIKVITNDKLLPVMENFNHSIRKISKNSTYCKIICADDWIYPEYLSQTVALGERNPHVGIVSTYRLVGGKVYPREAMPYRKTVFSGSEASRMNLLQGPYTLGSPTALLYRSQIVFGKEKFFNEDRTSGDTEACYEAFRNWDFGFVPQILSFHRLHEKSVTSEMLNLGKNMLDNVYILKQYGIFFLDGNESRQKEKELMMGYYRFLGSNPRKLLSKEFRDYQVFSVAKTGDRFEWKMVLWGWAYEAAGSLFDVKAHIKRLSR